MQRLGINLGVLNDRDPMKVPYAHPTCPGARIYITKADLELMMGGGETFDDKQTFVPRDGYGHARVRCEQLIEQRMGPSGHVVDYGLCVSCSRLEEDNRRELRARRGLTNQTREAAQ